MTKSIFIIYILLKSVVLQSQTATSNTSFNKQKLDKYFSVLEANNKFMGGVALYKKGKIIYSNQVGFLDVETKKEPNKNTKYRIGSISKMFTAAIIFKAIEQNKISLGSKLSKFFPSIENANLITIEMLLNHRSGIHNFTNNLDYLSYNTKPKSQKEMLSIIASKKNDFSPNSKASYSNSNYVLLSYILERLYKKSYKNILQEQIINPLSLENTYFGSIININNNESNSYRFLGEWQKQTETDTSIPMGAGGIVSTPKDLITFSNALFNNKIVAKESLKQMMTLKDRYGMGLFKIPFDNKFSYGHTGGIDGFSSVLGYFVDESSAFSIISNGNNYNNNKIAITLLSALFNKPYKIPDFKTFTPQSLDSYIGTYKNNQLSLTLNISQKNNSLIAQIKGQPKFSLEAVSKDTFEFKTAGVVLVFNTKNKTVSLQQNGGSYLFKK
ncbi:peptidase [Polaribacter porphyrae]|uniref:Peptidase n=1 Tax=Polaribacter porphyrae TaxID=1137780 RepID=A0A2S7WTZ9_9FLAO|nr:peptidase [Polaribacter porphyrae]